MALILGWCVKINILLGILLFLTSQQTVQGVDIHVCKGWSINETSIWHGTLSPSICSSDSVPVNTVCKLKCSDGYEFYSGDLLSRTCKFANGESKWYPLLDFGHCQARRCPRLQSTYGNGYSPNTCNKKGQIAGEMCYATKCPPNFSIVGPHQKQCGYNLTWSPVGGTYCQSHDAGHKLLCPNKIFLLKTEMGKGYADLAAKLPQLSSNVDVSQLEEGLLNAPYDMRKLPPGKYMLHVYVKLKLNWQSGKCLIRVSVKDAEPPIATNCPNVIELSVPVGEKTIVKYLDELEFNDNIDGANVTISITGDINHGQMYGVGEYSTTVTAKDSSGNQADCEITVQIREKPCVNYSPSSIGSIQVKYSNSNATKPLYTSTCPSTSQQSCDVYHNLIDMNDTFDVSRCTDEGSVKCVDFVLDGHVPGCLDTKPPTANGTCELGMKLLNNSCVSCPEGYMFNISTQFCTLCPANSTSSATVPTKCSPCPSGTMTKTIKGPWTCEAICPAGLAYSNDTGECVKCPINSYAKYLDTSCTSCRDGQIVMSSPGVKESNCVYGTSTQTTFSGSSVNKTVLPSSDVISYYVHLDVHPSFGDSHPNLQQIAIHSTSAFLSKLSNCKDFYIQVGYADRMTPRLCGPKLNEVNVLNFRPNDKLQVIQHSPSKSIDMEISFVLINCHPGRYFKPSVMACVQCPSGQYQNRALQLSCKVCPDQQITLSAGSTECTDPCLAGFFRNGTICSPCAVGTYRNKTQNESKCVSCPPNTTTAYEKTIAIEKCTVRCSYGKYVSDNRCLKCPFGTYQDKAKHGSLSCLLCPKGMTTVDMEARSKQMCIKKCNYEGEYYNSTVHNCLKCPIGTYKFASDVTVAACTLCPANHTTTSEGALSHLDCVDITDDCSSKPCQYPGRCVDGDSSYQCVCPMFSGGDKCEKNTNPCASNPCMDRATCIATNTSHSICQCPPDISNCKKGSTKPDSCHPNPCKHGGFCSSPQAPNATPSYKCQCTLDFSGIDCETANDSCLMKPCHHLGSFECVDMVFGFHCPCTAGYTGKTCSELTDEDFFVRVVGHVKFTDIPWRDSLKNSISHDFLAVKHTIESAIMSIHGLDKDFFDVIVQSFERGSVITHFTCYYYRDAKNPLQFLNQFINDGQIGSHDVDANSFNYTIYPAGRSLPQNKGSKTRATGIIIGVVVVLIVIAIVSIFLWWNSRRRRTRITFDRIMNDTTHLHPNIELS